MSRKWQRMVERNSKTANKYRAKTGHKPISAVTDDSEGDKIYGRNYILPILLILAAVFFMIVYSPMAQNNTLYWVTIGAYVMLALIYFLRRPFLQINKSTLSTRKMGRDRYLNPSDIEGIIRGKNHISIPLKGKKSGWFFSKTMNRYPIEEMTIALQKYAKSHGVPFIKEDKKK